MGNTPSTNTISTNTLSTNPTNTSYIYYINTLPSIGTLYDKNGIEITNTMLPYQLSNNLLTYKPNGIYTGNISFTYYGTDQFNVSNIGTITITVISNPIQTAYFSLLNPVLKSTVYDTINGFEITTPNSSTFSFSDKTTFVCYMDCTVYSFMNADNQSTSSSAALLYFGDSTTGNPTGLSGYGLGIQCYSTRPTSGPSGTIIPFIGLSDSFANYWSSNKGMAVPLPENGTYRFRFWVKWTTENNDTRITGRCLRADGTTSYMNFLRTGCRLNQVTNTSTWRMSQTKSTSQSFRPNNSVTPKTTGNRFNGDVSECLISTDNLSENTLDFILFNGNK